MSAIVPGRSPARTEMARVTRSLTGSRPASCASGTARRESTGTASRARAHSAFPSRTAAARQRGLEERLVGRTEAGPERAEEHDAVVARLLTPAGREGIAGAGRVALAEFGQPGDPLGQPPGRPSVSRDGGDRRVDHPPPL